MRIIVHVDMDAFYAAVEERLNPDLQGKPVVVGADPKNGAGRGVVTTANYAARKFGIRSALPISRAWRFAEVARRRGEPATVFLRPNMQLYQETSTRIMHLMESYADRLEEASIDEAYLDVSSHASLAAAAEAMADLKAAIRRQEGLGCSIGIGPNKLIAKIASSYRKPDGLTVITAEAVENFLAPMPIRAIPGIGPKGEQFLNSKNIRTISELRPVPEATLRDWFGRWGEHLFARARGIDDTEVSNDWVRKSLGEQETFETNTRDRAAVLARLEAMAERIVRKLQEQEFQGFRTVTLTVRFGDFQTCNRSRTLQTAILMNGEAHTALRENAAALLEPFFDARENPRNKAFRLIGLRVEKIFL